MLSYGQVELRTPPRSNGKYVAGTVVEMVMSPHDPNSGMQWGGVGAQSGFQASVWMTQDISVSITVFPTIIVAVPVKIATGRAHTCIVTSTGGVQCWGANDQGQLGDGTNNDSLKPVNVLGFTNGVAAISAGANHTCARTSPGGIKCWGGNGTGQLGDGTKIDRSTPVGVLKSGGPATFDSGVTAISAGDDHSCMVIVNAGVFCWGGNSFGQLGILSTSTSPLASGSFGVTTGTVSISAGTLRTCSVTSGGGIKCWGRELDFSAVKQPTDVKNLQSGFTAVATSGRHTCLLNTTGKVECWGQNIAGQVGDGTNDIRNRKVDVVGLSDSISKFSIGFEHNCALTTTGDVKCWGNNSSGQIGAGTNSIYTVPTKVLDLPAGVTEIAVGAGEHTCAITALISVMCWGSNTRGQLGDGTTNDSSTPVFMAGIIP